ncbi:MAG TPA: ParB/RepB/Spo0J family partition protein [Thermomicrobiales bacterium]|nr:ParB/RepB/Spo0J family partition protein [Thermomicrobiales bacterium]
MPDRSAPDEFEDILTGRRTSRSAASRRNQADSNEKPARPGRSRRKFTVDALFSDTRPQAVGVQDLPEAKEIALERIEADPNQPRRTFDEERLEELTESIRKEGVLQPIVVRYDAERDRYIIVHGERRYRASTRAERKTIPALVRNVPESRLLVQQLMENIVRDDLNAVDRARALRILKDQMDDAPWEEVAAEVGIRRSRLFQLLDTSKLPEPAQEHIRAGALSEKQSRALQGLPPVYQQELANAIVERAVPSQVSTRIGRALRQSSRLATTPEGARTHIDELLDLAISADDESRNAQIDRLLATLNEVISGREHDRAGLDEIATTLGAPSYTPARVTRSVGDLAQALAQADRDRIADDQELRERLRTLAGIIASLTGDADTPS